MAIATKQQKKSKHTGHKNGHAIELDKKGYEKELSRLQVELVQLEEWIRYKGLRVVVVFEGRDTAGEGGGIKRGTALLDPRYRPGGGLPAPPPKERTHRDFQLDA